jgi:ribosomal protein L11 methyltransferase
MHALAVWLEAPLADALSEQLLDDAEALSVTVEDADAGTAGERPVFDEPATEPSDGWRRARLTALFADEAAAWRAEAALRHLGPGIERTEVQPVAERDWVRATQAEFAPVDCGHGLWIVPGWHEPPGAARTVVRLDPGMAFGTGTHPTTRMCLGFLAGRAAAGTPWPRVLDYGTGSGILGIAAARLGASDIDAVDIDGAAVETARANALANGVSVRTGRPDIASGRYGLVLANILARPLVVLAPLLAGHVADGGELVLAGLLTTQVDTLREAYAPWLALEAIGSEDGWALLHGRRSAPLPVGPPVA